MYEDVLKVCVYYIRVLIGECCIEPVQPGMSSVSAQPNGPLLGNSLHFVLPTVNHHLDVAKDNTTLTAFAYTSIPNVKQHSVHSSASCAYVPSHPQDIDTPILQRTLGN